MTALDDFFEHVVKELTLTGPGNERPIAALQENDNADMTLLHALSEADKKPQLETKTHKLPVVWTNSSVSSPRMTVRSTFPLAFRNGNVAVAKSGQIIEVDNYSRRVSFNNGNDIVYRKYGEIFCFNMTVVDSDGRIWLSGTDRCHLMCINEEGQLLGVKTFSENTRIFFLLRFLVINSSSLSIRELSGMNNLIRGITVIVVLRFTHRDMMRKSQ